MNMPCPLVFTEIFKEKVWGGRALERLLGKTLPPGVRVGESWELSGCGDDQSRIADGAWAGRTLAEALAEQRPAILGSVSNAPAFPLLYKFIDANENLSVQLHPDDDQAAAGGWGVCGKTECWYVVDAKPDARIVCGLREGVTRDDVETGVREHTLPDLLNIIDIAAGDVLFVPAGTVHAILDGTVLYEMQESSDTTLRLYDWGRDDPDRPLHVAESLPLIDTTFHGRHIIPPVRLPEQNGIFHSPRVACRYFAMDEYRFTSAAETALPPVGSFQTLTVLSGSLTICSAAGEHTACNGRTMLLPAALGSVTVRSGDAARFLLSWVPELRTEVIEPLRRAGVDDGAIEALGGNPARNDIVPLL